MNYRATQGLFNGGFRPYGYAIVEKELVPYQKEKQVVEVIFKRFIETHSTTSVKQCLEENGLKYLEGRTWDIRQIQRILQNSVYIGKIKWAGQENEGVHAPIVTESTFARVQKIFSESEFTKSKGKTHAMFAKKLFCSHCGSPMAPSHSTNRYKTKYYYYRCTGSKNKRKNCGQKHFSFEQLDSRVIQILLSLSEEQHFRPIENKLLKHNEQVMTQIAEQEKSSLYLDSALNQLKIKKDKYLDTLLSSQFLSRERELINTKINEMEVEEKQLKTAILKQQFNVTQAKEEVISISEIKKKLIGYRSGYPFSDSLHNRAELSMVIEKIELNKDYLDISFIALPWKERFDMTPA
jgi:site-specific DNA recombinase